MSVHAGLLTVEEFLKLPEPKEGHLELHHGEAVVMPPPKKGHQKIQDRIQMLLKRLVGQKGVVRMEMAFRPTPEYEVWQADVGYVSLERDEATGDDEYLMGAPELVVEVLSPGRANERRDREVKLKLYSRRAVEEYWIADWRLRQIDVYRRANLALQLVTTLHESDNLETPLLPGFSCLIATLFDKLPS